MSDASPGRRVRIVERRRGKQITITVHVDEGIRDTSEIGVLTAYDDGSCAETLCFSDLFERVSRVDIEGVNKVCLLDKVAGTALYESNPRILSIGAMWTNKTKRRTSRIGCV